MAATATAPSLIRGMTSKSLVKAVFDSDYPEQFVRSLPSQSLFLAIKQNGLLSSGDLIDLCSVEQTRLFLDLDLWDRDNFSEERFWEWLELSDENDPLKHTQKILKSIDLKLVSLLISRYVLAKIFDEPTENPPTVGYYTPDKGYTWIFITIEDKHRHFLFTRFLALIFETHAELFYQLVSIPQVSTESMLEEESYQERSKRLTTEGFPDPEMTSKINAPIDRASLSALFKKSVKRAPTQDVRPIEPLLYDSYGAPQPLGRLMSEISDREQLESELTLIMNAAIVYWSVPHHEYEAVLHLTSKVKGAINIGLQSAIEVSKLSLKEIYEIGGLQTLYRSGLMELKRIRKNASAITISEAQLVAKDQPDFSVLAHARLSFPEAPIFLKDDGSYEISEGSLRPGSRAIETLKDIESILGVLNRISAYKKEATSS